MYCVDFAKKCFVYLIFKILNFLTYPQMTHNILLYTMSCYHVLCTVYVVIHNITVNHWHMHVYCRVVDACSALPGKLSTDEETTD